MRLFFPPLLHLKRFISKEFRLLKLSVTPSFFTQNKTESRVYLRKHTFRCYQQLFALSGLLPSPKTPATPLVISFHALLRQSMHWRYCIIGSEDAKTLRQKETCIGYKKIWWRHGLLASTVPRYMGSGDDWAPASRYACGLLEIWEEFDNVQLVERVEKVRKGIWNATLYLLMSGLLQ